MSAPAPLLGAVLAGGAGVRFGGPKGPALLADGRSFARRAVEALRPVVADVVVVSSRPVGDPGAPVIPDAMEGAGPLGGVLAALREADSRGLEGVLVLACDLPRVGPDVLSGVAARRGLGAIVAPARPGGGVEPLCAVYAASARPAVEAALADGRHALHALFEAVAGVAVDPAELGGAGPDTFLNVNTPADLETARRGSESASRSPDA